MALSRENLKFAPESIWFCWFVYLVVESDYIKLFGCDHFFTLLLISTNVPTVLARQMPLVRTQDSLNRFLHLCRSFWTDTNSILYHKNLKLGQAGSFECACNQGYAGDGFTCGDYNECLARLPQCDLQNGKPHRSLKFFIVIIRWMYQYCRLIYLSLLPRLLWWWDILYWRGWVRPKSKSEWLYRISAMC